MNRRVIISLFIVSTLTFTACSSPNVINNQNTNPTQQVQSNQQLQYYFSQENKGNPDKQLINVINSAKNSLDIAIYSLTKKEIVNAVIDAKSKGVKIRIISDKIESNNKYQRQELLLLRQAGIPIKVNTHSGLMHMKVSIVDNSTVTTGSYNYTEAATNKNDEVLVIIHNDKAAQDFDNEFTAMWNDDDNFKDF